MQVKEKLPRLLKLSLGLFVAGRRIGSFLLGIPTSTLHQNIDRWKTQCHTFIITCTCFLVDSYRYLMLASYCSQYLLEYETTSTRTP